MNCLILTIKEKSLVLYMGSVRYNWDVVLNIRTVVICRTTLWKICVRSDEMDACFLIEKKQKQKPMDTSESALAYQAMRKKYYILQHVFQKKNHFLCLEKEKRCLAILQSLQKLLLCISVLTYCRYTSKITQYCEEREFKMYEVKLALVKHTVY